MKAEITTITPEQAEKMLRGNTNNRTLRERLVNRYAHDMENGDWLPNGEAIVMNGRTLIDGQHRLHACVKSGVPFKTVLVTGVSLDAVYTIDTGAARNLSDILSLNGVNDSRSVAGVITMGWLWDNGKYVGANVTPSISDLMRWFESNPGVEAALESVRLLRPAPFRVRFASMATVALKARQHGLTEEMDNFIDSVVTGTNLDQLDAAYHLRNLFLTQATAHKKLPPRDVHARIIKAWNAHIMGEEMGALIWKSRGQRRWREPFPVMVDADGNPISFVPADD